MNFNLIHKILFLFFLFFENFYAQSKSTYDLSKVALDVYSNIENTNVVKLSWDIAEKRSKSGDSYQFMALRKDFGFINEMILSKELSVIDNGIILINNIISSSQISSSIKNNKNYKDSYKGWISMNERNEFHKEVALYESYSFLYITEFLYILEKIGWVNESENNLIWWKESVRFIEKHIWSKWLERSRILKNKDYWYFLRQRVHMGSHWAGIAMYLGSISRNEEVKRQTEEVQEQFDLLLKRNFKEINSCFIWNSTYDNVSGTDASSARKEIVQDVSHGNHVVAYIISSYEFGNKRWEKQDIQKLSNTFKNIVFDASAKQFSDNVDGSSDSARPGWGNFIADGWVRLGAYDKDVEKILVEFKNSELLVKYHQYLQYNATMYKNNK